MSSQVIASPDTMRDFSGILERSNYQLNDLMSHMSTQLSYLGDSWRDQHYDKFKETFEQAAHSLSVFLQNSENYVHYLRQKSEALERVNEIRVPY